MRRRASPDQDLFRFYDVAAGDIAAFADAIAEIHAGTYTGLVLRGALSPVACQALLDALAQQQDAFERVGFPMRVGASAPPFTLGRPLMLSPAPETYRAAAAAFNAAASRLWGQPEEPRRSIESWLAPFAGGRPVQPARHGPAPCAMATVRVLPPGCDIGAHVGNDFVFLPQAAALAETVDVRCQLSWFVPLRAAERGGELEVYGLGFDDTAPLRRDRPPGSDGMDELKGLTFLVDLADSQLVAPRAGDLVLFDGGRWYHRVRPVGGEHSRVTLGGFLAFSPDHERIVYWS